MLRLSNKKRLGFLAILLIGGLFSPNLTAANIKLWQSHDGRIPKWEPTEYVFDACTDSQKVRINYAKYTSGNLNEAIMFICGYREVTQEVKNRVNDNRLKITSTSIEKDLKTDDPCVGKHKYVEILYSCVPENKPDQDNAVQEDDAVQEDS